MRTAALLVAAALGATTLVACSSTKAPALADEAHFGEPLAHEREGTPAAVAPVTLEEIFADQEWVARSPQGAHFGVDGVSVLYRRERAGSDVEDRVRIERATLAQRVLGDGEHGPLNLPGWRFAPQRSQVSSASTAPAARAFLVHAGNLFLWDGADVEQLTRGTSIGRVEWSHDLAALFFEDDGAWWRLELAGGAPHEVARSASGDEPKDEVEAPEGFRAQAQERLIEVVRERTRLERERQDAERARTDADRTRAPRALHVGAGKRAADTRLSPHGDTLVVVVERDERSDENTRDLMPVWLTDSADVETRRVRPHVGDASSEPQQLVLFDLATREKFDVSFAALRGLVDDPLAALRDTPREAGPRDLRVRVGPWSPDGRHLALQLYSTDDKDRWTALVDCATRELVEVHRENDPAWVGGFGEIGWVPGTDRLWFLSEESGWSHLFVCDVGGAPRALTSGRFEVDDVRSSPDGATFFFVANATDHGVHEVWSVPVNGGASERRTHFDGRVGSYEIARDGRSLLCSVSRALEPTEVYEMPVEVPLGGAFAARRLTNTIEPAWAARGWVEPEYVLVPGRAGGVPARLYRPAGAPSGKRPAVLFVHGAGYLQNAHRGFSTYQREFMFHTFLVQHGFVVLDMDYRASAGYGRDWRTAIHRDMGGPELEDLVDGAEWLARELDVDPERIGVYGGSYGGFMTLMALFKAPDVFACGAALRPVTDWSHYNDPYTSNILHTPALDEEAYLRSSPIEFAEGLADPLLICHGFIDDNVLAKDSIRLSQRLIELGKQDFEVMLYPAEAHAFRWPSSWLDEYRRIWKLFEEHLLEP